MPKIIGVTGPSKGGKETFTQYTLAHYGGIHLSVRDFITAHFNKSEKKSHFGEALIDAGNRLRQENGADYTARELYRQALESNQRTIIESIRNPMEAQFLLDHKCILVGVDADLKLIWERIMKETKDSARRYSSFDEYKEQIEREMHNPDPTMQNISQCLKMCHHVFMNNLDEEALYKEIDIWLPQLLEGINPNKERKG